MLLRGRVVHCIKKPDKVYSFYNTNSITNLRIIQGLGLIRDQENHSSTHMYQINEFKSQIKTPQHGVSNCTVKFCKLQGKCN